MDRYKKVKLHIFTHLQIANRVDTEENVELVDTPLDIDPRNKNKNVQKEPAKEVVQAERLKRLEKLKEKISPKEFGKHL